MPSVVAASLGTTAQAPRLPSGHASFLGDGVDPPPPEAFLPVLLMSSLSRTSGCLC